LWELDRAADGGACPRRSVVKLAHMARWRGCSAARLQGSPVRLGGGAPERHSGGALLRNRR
jgi:hypothetical protein